MIVALCSFEHTAHQNNKHRPTHRAMQPLRHFMQPGQAQHTLLSTSCLGSRASESDAGGCREHMNIVFIGHVDAGKSTIGGQILYLTVCTIALAKRHALKQHAV